MVGVVIKGPDSAIYGEDTCAPVQYAYCTLAHVHTSIVQYMEPDKAAVSSLRLLVLLQCGQQSEV